MIVFKPMHKLKLKHWFFIWLGIMIGIAVILQPDERPDKFSKPGFSTTRQSEMYFRNIRSFYYATTEEAEGILYAHRLNALFDENDNILLPFVIYHNWRTHEAFIRLDTNYYAGDVYPFAVADSAGVRIDTIWSPDLWQEAQSDFAKAIYIALIREKKITFPKSDTSAVLTGQERTATRRVLTDYFTLIGKL